MFEPHDHVHDHAMTSEDRIHFLPDMHWLHNLEDHIVHDAVSAEVLLMAAVVFVGGWLVTALTAYNRRRPVGYRAW
jgi:hypothetical protein